MHLVVYTWTAERLDNSPSIRHAAPPAIPAILRCVPRFDAEQEATFAVCTNELYNYRTALVVDCWTTASVTTLQQRGS